jgi:hypothetical protein
MAGDTELADEEGIEGRVECRGNLSGDGNAATGKPQNDDVGTTPKFAQVGRKLLAGVGPVAEWDRHRTLRESAAAVDDADARTARRRVCISPRVLQIRGQGDGAGREVPAAVRGRNNSVRVAIRRRRIQAR